MTDQGSSALERALRAARDATGSAEDVERLRRKLDVTLTGDAATANVENVAQPVAAGVAGKAWVWIVGAVLGIASSMLLLQTRAPAARSVILSPPAAAAHEIRTHGAQQATPSQPAAPVSANSELQPSRSRAPTGASLSVTSVGRRPASALEPKHAALLHSTAKVAQAAAAEHDPDTEVGLVTRAQALVAARPAEALTLLLEHERRFPHGILVQERDTLRIDAERVLGQTVQAREHARAFVAAFPDSPQARGLKQWLAVDDRDVTHHNPARVPVLTP